LFIPVEVISVSGSKYNLRIKRIRAQIFDQPLNRARTGKVANPKVVLRRAFVSDICCPTTEVELAS
jgi:hypothetical protein